MLAHRLTAQLLSGPPARSPVEVAERLLAVQAQDPRGARLAVRARTQGTSAADVDRALTQDRSLLVAWLNRGTLHLVRSEDYAWLHALTTPQLLTGSARRLRQEGVTPSLADRGVTVIERALVDEGPLVRRQLADRLEAAHVPTAGQALFHLLFLAGLRGLVVRGPMAGGEQAYVLVRDWLGEPAPVDRDRALAELARRFLAGHGPASDRDLAKWAGVPLREARRGLSEIAPELDHRHDGLADLVKRAEAAELPPPRLLGAFDPVLHGWVSREPMLDARMPIITVNGLFRPFALVRGRAAALWSLRAGNVEIVPFDRLTRADARALDAEALDVRRFLASS